MATYTAKSLEDIARAFEHRAWQATAFSDRLHKTRQDAGRAGKPHMETSRAAIAGNRTRRDGIMPLYSAIITCTTECEIQITADNETNARAKIERGEFVNVRLHDGMLDMRERFHDIEIEPGSFGKDSD